MRRFLTTITVMAVLSAPVWAGPRDEIGYRGMGPRVGVSSNPDQVHIGAHMDLGYFAERFLLQPNLELGFGGGRMLAAFNLETAYRFSTAWGVWSPYVGGGIGIDRVSRDRFPGGSDADLGASILGGIERGLSGGDRFFLETKIGLVDAPDLKLTVGWTFY